MKRFLVFLGDDYYPCGGMEDFAGDFDTIQEAYKCVKREIEKEVDENYTSEEIVDKKWCHIYDSLVGLIQVLNRETIRTVINS